MDETKFREAVAAEGSDARDFIVLPGPDESRDPEGCVVVDGRGQGWLVYREDRGVKDRVEFTSQDEAFDYALRRWVRYDDA